MCQIVWRIRTASAATELPDGVWSVRQLDRQINSQFYAREHWIHEGENPPVGLILCARKDEAVARYALEGLPNKVMAAEYRTALPDEKTLAAEIRRTQEILRKREAFLLPPQKSRERKTAARSGSAKNARGQRK
jgi:hypothetical protein